MNSVLWSHFLFDYDLHCLSTKKSENRRDTKGVEMSESVRLYRYKSLLSSRRAISVEDLMAAQEVSRATLKRDIAKLRDQLHVPIEFNRELGGYTLDPNHADSELPGLWFSQGEILALVTIQQLLEQLQPGLLGTKLRPLQERLTQLMDKHGLAGEDVAKRIRIVHAGKRTVIAKSFEVVAAATMARKHLKIWHFNRQNGITTERDVSPQRLVHYRDNWYLGAWCHLRDDVRSFSIDAISRLEVQESATEADDSYLLSFPYSDDRELIGDIMRFGADVQVLAPPALRAKVQRSFLEAAAKYV